MCKEFAFRCHRCGLDYRCHRADCLATPTPAGWQSRCCIANLDCDVLGTQAKLFCDDHGDNRSDTGADILRTGGRFDSATCVDGYTGFCSRSTAATPQSATYTDTTLLNACTRAGDSVASVPADLLRAERIFSLTDPVSPGVAVTVYTAEFEWIYVQLFSKFIHQRIHGKGTLWMPRCTHGARTACVDCDRRLFSAIIWDMIDIRTGETRPTSDTACAVAAHVISDEPTILRCAGTDRLRHRRTIAANKVLILTGQHQLDRCARYSCELRNGDPFHARTELTAEATRPCVR